MKDQLIRYVDLLFAAAPNAGDIKQEILQNTLDRYDDLVAQGKTPEAAYSLAISGIGDISELLGNTEHAAVRAPEAAKQPTLVWKKVLRALGVFLYIFCPAPLFVLSEFGMETIGLCGTLAIVGVATALMIIASGGQSEKKKEQPQPESLTPRQELNKAIKTGINTVGLIVYFVLSFLTQAWWITWLVFPIMATVNALVKACLDLKEAQQYEI